MPIKHICAKLQGGETNISTCIIIKPSQDLGCYVMLITELYSYTVNPS